MILYQQFLFSNLKFCKNWLVWLSGQNNKNVKSIAGRVLGYSLHGKIGHKHCKHIAANLKKVWVNT